MGGEIAVVHDLFLVNIFDNAPPQSLRAMVAMDVETLSPRGLVRPPRADLHELCQLGDGKFGVVLDGKLHSWHLRV